MLRQHLEGPYRLDVDGIRKKVPVVGSGVFALGYIDQQGAFRIRYVGRSDNTLPTTLQSFIGSDLYFKYAAFRNVKESFLYECKLFHEFLPPANRLHPERPRGVSTSCPYCLS
jgi:hypothetical protein